MIRNWNDISLVVAVARHGSTNAAAAATGTSASTISRRIENLESHLSLVLFEKSPAGYSLTSDGEALLHDCEQVALRIKMVENKAKSLKRLGSGILKITAPETVFTEVLHEICEQFKSLNPNMRFDYVASDSRLDVASGEVDIAFRGTEELEDSDLICKRLRDFQWTAFASETLERFPTSPEQLYDYPVVVYSGEMANIKPSKWFMSHVDPSKIVAECNSLVNMAMHVKTGRAIGLLSTGGAEQYAGCRACFAPSPASSSSFWLVCSQEVYRKQLTRQFIDFASKRFNKRLDELHASVEF